MGNWTFRNLVLIWTENVSILKFATEHKVTKIVILKNIFNYINKWKIANICSSVCLCSVFIHAYSIAGPEDLYKNTKITSKV